MKIKVNKKEYEQLLARVEQLERDNANSWEKFFDAERKLRQEFRDSLESYFTNKCQVVMVKRDKDEIVAELRKRAMDNIFREQEKE